MRTLHRWFVPLVSGFILFAAPPASAQVSAALKAGLNLATVSVEPELNLDYGHRADWQGGLVVANAPESTVGAQIEILYSRRGSSVKVGTSDTLDADYRLSFIDIPVLLRTRAARLDNGGIFILAGPTIGIGLKSETEQSGINTDVSDRFENYEVGITLGTAIESQGFIIDARYTHGVTNYANGSHPAVQEMKIRTLSFSAGFRF